MVPISLRAGILLTALGAIFIATCAFAQTQEQTAGGCSDPAAIFSRYIDALGGRQAIDRLVTRVAEARETEPYTFKPQEMATYNYRFKWKSPDKLVVNFTHVVSMAGLHVPFAKAHFVFDGELWSDFRGKTSPNPIRRRPVRAFPTTYEALWRVTADPLLFAHPGDLYSDFEPANDFASHPDRCVLKAYGVDGRVDLLYFDRASGFLREWRLDLGSRRRSYYMIFSFDDYRQAGEVMFPFYIYSDLYKATFRYQKVFHNQPLPDSDFEVRR